jgi:hypothetical protein
LPADLLVRVAGPRHIRVGVERYAKRSAVGGDDDRSGLACDKQRAEVVRMRGDHRRQAAFGEHRAEQRARVGDEAVVPRRELVELPPAQMC